MATPDRLEPFPENTFYAKIDNELAVQDYGDGLLCIRLVAVSKKSFEIEAFNDETGDGCETYIVDISMTDYLAAWFPEDFHHILRLYREKTSEIFLVGFISYLNYSYQSQGDWLRVDFEKSSEAVTSYAYTAFREDEPIYLRVTAITPTPGKAVDPPPTADSNYLFPVATPGATTLLSAFHVGQGMCSLLEGGDVGYLFDAGAGTPLKKGAYRRGLTRTGAVLANDLGTATASLRLVAIISHPDSDHWRLLEWDAGLAAKVDAIFVPAGTSNLAFSSPLTKKKVFGLGDKFISFSANSVIDVSRSKPKTRHLTTNTDALVVTVEVAGKKALIPGDYVYGEMPYDNAPRIANIPQQMFDAVVVPHHGDQASSKDVPSPRFPAQSVAFFSAGDNLGYGHPTTASRTAHQKKGYKNIVNNLCEHIIGVKLLP